jgi:hypothetical protein
LVELAKLLGWLTANNKPNRGLVYRTAATLQKAKLIKKGRRGGFELTDAGKTELKSG